MKKEKALETINEFPQEFELEDLLEKLIFVEKVDKGLKELEDGKTLPHEQVKTRVREWKK
jgi:hypothetical protein